MQRPEKIQMLTADEIALVENYRHINIEMREAMLGLSEDYRELFPFEVPKLRIVPPK